MSTAKGANGAAMKTPMRKNARNIPGGKPAGYLKEDGYFELWEQCVRSIEDDEDRDGKSPAVPTRAENDIRKDDSI